MPANPLQKLAALGQSIWLDYIRRDLITSGNLKKFIMTDNLKGITSNPSIFEKAIIESNLYKIEGENTNAVYENLTQADVKDAADEFRDLYHKTQAKDGYVSLEVNPHLAHDTNGTIEEARRLWKALARPNVFIKVPATREGLPAITTLISEGINVNVTLLFGIPRYREVADAYMSGLELRVSRGESLKNIASVASFFISRIDTLIDPLLEKQLQGQVAIASAKIAYQIYLEIINSSRFKALSAKDAQAQRLLWASTSTKNPAYSDIKYIEALIGKDTVNTVPMETLDAYRDHGDPKLRIEDNVDEAQKIFQKLLTLNIDINKLTQQLENEGVDKFNKSYDQLIAALEKRMNHG